MKKEKKPNGRRWSCPETAELAARALIKHGLNATQAAKELRPHLTDESARVTGVRMMQTPEVRTELERQLVPRGLDERSRDRYVERLWAWYEGDDKQLAQTAARILGRGFIGQKIVEERPEVLHIEGFEEGIRRMGFVQEEEEDEDDEDPTD